MKLVNDREANIRGLNLIIPTIISNPVLQKLCLTQAVHESNLLNKPSGLALNYNNLFGIKGEGITGKSVMLPTWEHINGKDEKVTARFAQNDSLEDSIRQYNNLMQKDRYKIVRESSTLDDAFINIVKAGYATDENYTKCLKDVYNIIQKILN